MIIKIGLKEQLLNMNKLKWYGINVDIESDESAFIPKVKPKERKRVKKLKYKQND